jgi:hypothetical protein
MLITAVRVRPMVATAWAVMATGPRLRTRPAGGQVVFGARGGGALTLMNRA